MDWQFYIPEAETFETQGKEQHCALAIKVSNDPETLGNIRRQLKHWEVESNLVGGVILTNLVSGQKNSFGPETWIVLMDKHVETLRYVKSDYFETHFTPRPVGDWNPFENI